MTKAAALLLASSMALAACVSDEPSGGSSSEGTDGGTTTEELQRGIDQKSPGDTIVLTVVRDGEELELDVTLTSRPA